MEKIKSDQESLNVGIKLNINSVICHQKHVALLKLKVYFLKCALKAVKEEFKGVNLIKQI